MNTMVTIVTERGQISIPSAVRRALHLKPGERLSWETTGENECRVRRMNAAPVKGAMAMRGYARQFREVRRTEDWMRELREGEGA